MAHRPKPKYASKDPHEGPWTTCDLCGLIWSGNAMRFQYDFMGGASPQRTGPLVCPKCEDALDYQQKLLILPPDPAPFRNTRPEQYAIDEAGPTQDLAASVGMDASELPATFFLDLYDGDPSVGGESVLAALTGSATRTNYFSSMTVSEGAPVFIFAGQSNVRTHGVTAVPPPLQTPSANTKIWNIQTQAWETYTAGTNSETVLPGQNVFGPEGEFARLWRAANPGETCYIIKYGVDSSSLAPDGSPDWDPNGNELFSAAAAQIAAALAALADVPNRVHAVFWMQGESDSLVEASANAYNVNLTALVAAVRSRWSAPLARFVVGRISDASAWTFRSPVRLAQAAVAAVGGNAAVVNTDAYSMQIDGIHYDATGVTSLGTDFYAAYAGTYTSAFVTAFNITLTQNFGATITYVNSIPVGAFAAVPAGVVTRARVRITGPVTRVFIGQQAPVGDAYDALSLTQVFFSGAPGLSQALGATTWSDVVSFYWDGETPILVSLESNALIFNGDQPTGVTAYFSVGALEANVVNKTGYGTLANFCFMVSGIELGGIVQDGFPDIPQFPATNNAVITVTESAEATAEVGWAVIFDAAIGGNIIGSGALVVPQVVTLYNGAAFAVGALRATLT